MHRMAVSVQNVTKSYGSHLVLDDLCLEVPQGHTLALLGRNGVGKTTLVRALLGLIPVDDGSIRVADCDPASHADLLRRRVGYLAEDQVMYGWMTAVELCRFLAPFYPTWETQLADQYLERFELPRHVPIKRLSKGQTVKLGLAVALAHSPPVVILDDPTLGLDPVSRKEFNRDLVEHLQADGRTVIYSSHLLDEVEAVADLVAILKNGRIVRLSPPDSLRHEVQRVVLAADVARKLAPPSGLLDAHRQGDLLEIIVDGAPDFLNRLQTLQVPAVPSHMTLNDIFEAFAIGRSSTWDACVAP